MRLPLVPLILTLLVCVGSDAYIYHLLRRRFVRAFPARLQLWSAMALYIMFAATLCIPRRGGSDSQLLLVMWLLFGFFSVYIPKILFVVFDAVASLPLLWHKHRWRWMSVTGVVLSVAMFVAMWWGALVNRLSVQVREVEIVIDNLPEAYDGYRMLQFSDFHVGTYGNDTSYVSRIVDKINAIDADVILFTGDIVNRRTEELVPFVPVLSRLHARDGVYSILGNHDYGDYSDWPSDDDKQENMVLMDSLQKAMGWRLLRNEYDMLYRGADSLALIGVENVGDPPFKIYGSLPASYPILSDSVCKVLLSHNPAHWTSEIEDNKDMNIALTLSGHTHAMQIEVSGLSPAVWRYPKWGGKYTDASGRHLYVNIGIGTVAVPMRVGATPELTVITLRSPK